jgi:hypothetical protein
MKTKDLIKELQTADPSGEIECCIDNAAISYIVVEEAYYDGALHVIEFNENHHPVRGYRQHSGEKVVISHMYINDAVDWPDFKVEYLTEEDRKRYEIFDVENRRSHDQVEMDVERGHFIDWVFFKMQMVRKVPMSWVKAIKDKATAFFEEHKIGPDNPFTKMQLGRSYNDCREEYYEETFHVTWDSYSRIIIELKPKSDSN